MKRSLFWLILLVMLTGCGAQQVESGSGRNTSTEVIDTTKQTPAQMDFYAMDTVMNIRAYGDDAQQGVNECVAYINALEKKISRTQEDGEIGQLNEADGATVSLSEETADVLNSALELAERTDGAFDPTIAAYSDLWQIGTDHARLPGQDEIGEAKKMVGFERIKVDGTDVTMDAGMKIDLGGIGKGYAADRCVEILQEHGVSQGILSLAGNVYVMGQKAEGVDWTVAITDPDDPQGYLGTLTVRDISVVTSGDYERYFEQDGKRYCHIFDRDTGYPADTDLRSVTVVSANSTEADAYSTALFVMGYDRALQFCQDNDVQAILVRDDHTVTATDGLRDCFELLNTEYTYEG